MNKESLGKFVRAHREKLGLSRRLFSQMLSADPARLKVSEVYLQNVEDGKSAPPPGKLFNWSEAMKVDARDLYEAAEEPYPFEEKPEHYIALPDHFPPETKTQLETFVKFIQYQKEFEQFLKLYHAAPVQFEGNVEDFVNNLISEELKKRDQAS